MPNHADSRRRIRLPEFLDRYLEVHLKVKDPKSWEKELGRLRRIRTHFGDRYLHHEEYQALLDACDADLRGLVIVAANTGMRRGELLALRHQDIDLERGYLRVRADNSKTSEGRVVPLNSEALAALKGLPQQADGRVFGMKKFPRSRWQRIRRDLGWADTENPRLKGWRFHDLRHHAASQLVMADVPLSKIAKILGHKLLETTQRYAHLADDSLFEAMERIVTSTRVTATGCDSSGA